MCAALGSGGWRGRLLCPPSPRTCYQAVVWCTKSQFVTAVGTASELQPSWRDLRVPPSTLGVETPGCFRLCLWDRDAAGTPSHGDALRQNRSKQRPATDYTGFRDFKGAKRTWDFVTQTCPHVDLSSCCLVPSLRRRARCVRSISEHMGLRQATPCRIRHTISGQDGTAIFSQVFLISFSTAMDSGSPARSWQFPAPASTAAQHFDGAWLILRVIHGGRASRRGEGRRARSHRCG